MRGPLTNPKHELFAQSLVKGMSASEAYVRAGYKKNDGNAVRLKGNEKVATRLSELRAISAERHQLTVDDLVDELEEARTVALRAPTPQSSAAIAATMGKAKLLGHGVDRIEHTGLGGGAIQIETKHTLNIATLTPEQREALREIIAAAVESHRTPLLEAEYTELDGRHAA